MIRLESTQDVSRIVHGGLQGYAYVVHAAASSAHESLPNDLEDGLVALVPDAMSGMIGVAEV
jgi:hypothetical protein